jgi:prevent-host-death family protein
MNTMGMTLTVTAARANLYKLIDETNELHRPVYIHGKRESAVLIAEEDWRSIQETLYLLSIPGMRQSIRKGLKTPINRCVEEVKW